MSNSYVSSGENNDQSQSSATPTVDKPFRVEPTSVSNFINKLYTILNDNTIHEMVSWSNDGERFCVYDIPRFSKSVLPQYFKHSNWPSFVRQLNMYGFHKMNDNFSARHGRLICEFHHPLFYQNGRRSLRKIRRNSGRKSTSASLGSISRQLKPQQPPPPQPQQQLQSQQQSSPRNNQCQIQIQSPQESSQSTVAHPESMSCIPILSLLSSNDHDCNNKRTDYGNESMHGNNNVSNKGKGNEMEYLGRCIATNDDDDDSDNENNHNHNHMDHAIGGNSNNFMSISNLATENNDKNDTAYTPFINQNSPRINVDHGAINMDLDDDKHYYHHHDGKDDTSYRDEIDNTDILEEYLDDDIELPTELYMMLSARLNQLRKKTSDLHSEIFLLKRYVAQLRQSVTVLLNCLSDMLNGSDLHGQDLLDKIQVELAKVSSCSKNNSQLDDKEHHHISHDHHHYHHHYYQGKDTLNNKQVLQHDDFDTTNYDNDIDTLKEGIRNILQKSRLGTDTAKKNHHMHLHSQENDNWKANFTCSTLLDPNNNKQQ